MKKYPIISKRGKLTSIIVMMFALLTIVLVKYINASIYTNANLASQNQYQDKDHSIDESGSDQDSIDSQSPNINDEDIVDYSDFDKVFRNLDLINSFLNVGLHHGISNSKSLELCNLDASNFDSARKSILFRSLLI